MNLIWLAVAITFGILEVMTTSLTLIWFSIGAVVAMFISVFTDSIIIQVLIFGIVSVTLLIMATKKLVLKDKDHHYSTNLKRIISKKGVVKKDINPNDTGLVVVEGEEWTSISLNNEKIEEGSVVKVLKIEGVKLVVEKETN